MSLGRGEPRLLGGEAGDRRQPRGQEGEQLGHHRARRAPAQASWAHRSRSRPCGCRSRRPRDRRRRNCAARCAMVWKSKSSTALREHRVELGQAMQHPALELGQLGVGRPSPCRRVAVEAAQQIAQRVAQPAIGLGLVLQDLRADALVLGVVGADHPQAQDVGAVLVAHGLRRGDVAQRLRHLAALLVEREAVRQHAVVGRAAARAAALEQRGMEPAAMLVGALEIEIGRPLEVGIALEREDVRRARVEPDVEDVRHLLVVLGLVLVAEEALGRALEPGVGALGLEGLDDPAPSPRDRATARRSSCRRTPRSARPRRAGATRTSRAAARSSSAGGCSRRAARSAWRRSPPAPSRARCRRSRRSACPWR